MAATPVPNPPANAFSHRFRVRSEHIDQLGHAGNVAWLGWVNEAAVLHSQSVGLDFSEYQRLGLLWVVRRHELVYLGEALEGDELEASTWIDGIRAASSRRRTLIRSESETVLLSAETDWVLIRVDTRKPTRIPRELLARYGFEP